MAHASQNYDASMFALQLLKKACVACRTSLIRLRPTGGVLERLRKSPDRILPSIHLARASSQEVSLST
jgi:hypothetical protein